MWYLFMCIDAIGMMIPYTHNARQRAEHTVNIQTLFCSLAQYNRHVFVLDVSIFRYTTATVAEVVAYTLSVYVCMCACVYQSVWRDFAACAQYRGHCHIANAWAHTRHSRVMKDSAAYLRFCCAVVISARMTVQYAYADSAEKDERDLFVQ